MYILFQYNLFKKHIQIIKNISINIKKIKSFLLQIKTEYISHPKIPADNSILLYYPVSKLLELPRPVLHFWYQIHQLISYDNE